MTQLHERLALGCALPQAWDHLNRAICQLSEYQEPDIIRLRLPLAGAAGPALHKDVTLRYRRDPDAKNDHHPWFVEWQAVGGGPYPDFKGALTIDVDESNNTAVLVLEGEYAPPLGIAGQAFDHVIGSRMASITARDFLCALGAKIEKRSLADDLVI